MFKPESSDKSFYFQAVDSFLKPNFKTHKLAGVLKDVVEAKVELNLTLVSSMLDAPLLIRTLNLQKIGPVQYFDGRPLGNI